ncbi:unnamed protein product [Urochloa humidicola]
MQQMALPIAELVLPTLVLLIPLYLYIKLRRSKNASLPTDWPILGVLPCIAANRHSLLCHLRPCRHKTQFQGLRPARNQHEVLLDV